MKIAAEALVAGLAKRSGWAGEIFAEVGRADVVGFRVVAGLALV